MPKTQKLPPTILIKKDVDWTFLSNHAHVLICLNKKSDMLLREVAIQVGITERAVLSIVRDLVDAKILEIEKEGRRNRYKIRKELKLRHPLESHHTIQELLALGK